MAKQEVLLREWVFENGATVSVGELEKALQDIVQATGLNYDVYRTTFQNIPAVAVLSNPRYMPVYHYLSGSSVIAEVEGKGEQVRAEDLASLYSKATAVWSDFNYAKNRGRMLSGGGMLNGIAAGVGAAAGLAIRGSFKLLAKGVRVLLRDQGAWEREIAFYQNALGLGDFVIGGVDSIDAIAKITAQAENNNPIAQYVLGLAYAEGRGVQVSEEMALQWLAKAAENGELRSQGIIAQEYLYGQRDYGIEQKSIGIQYLNHLASSGEAWAIESLVDIYAKGTIQGIPVNYGRAVQIAETYAAKGSIYSAMILASICDQTFTDDVAAIRPYQDYAKAAAIYQKIADSEEPSDYKGEAAYRLAQMFHQGKGVDRNNENAVHYYVKADREGHLEAKKFLAESYTFGGITGADPISANRLANELIRSGDENYLPAAYYCKYILADKAANYKDSMDAANKYINLPNANQGIKQKVEQYLREQRERINRMTEEERRVYLKEPPKKKYLKYILAAAGVLLAVIIGITIAINVNENDDYDDDSTTESLAYSGYAIESEEEAVDFAESYFWDTYGDSAYMYDELEFYCDGVFEYSYIVKGINGYDEATGEPYVIYSVEVTDDGHLYYYDDGSMDYMD